jgi:hypothetical protein
MRISNCGGKMGVVAFVEEKILVEKIFRHYKIWQERKPQPPPKPPPNQLIPPVMVERSILDFDFFERNCAKKLTTIFMLTAKPKASIFYFDGKTRKNLYFS